ncbi:MAG: MurR/RpiR family transcriptional regulator [Thermomicrobiales bacterium]|nr:MurR/RpiR family transcriptional regulator [Thermomicrobiales bacterium]
MARPKQDADAVSADLNSLLCPSGMSLTRQQRRIADFFLARPEIASYASAQHVAEELGIDSSTIVRYAQALGFRGYPALQEAARDIHLGYVGRAGNPDETTGIPAPLQLADTITREIRNVEMLRSSVQQSEIDRAAQSIARARHTMILASGAYGALGIVLEHLGHLIGYNITLENRETWHAGARIASLTPDDLLIYMSFWWIDSDHRQMVSSARERGVPQIIFTNQRHEDLQGDQVQELITPTRSQSFYTSLVAPLTVVYAILDRLEEIDPDRSQGSYDSAKVLYETLNLTLADKRPSSGNPGGNK